MSINSILLLVAGFLVMIIVALALIYLSMTLKEKNTKKEKEKDEDNSSITKEAKVYSRSSIFDFMEFEKIEDNMAIQKKGKKFLMFIECQGINYDLMSEMEKTSVERGFIQFLNTLRDPIQIYVQTRTINLESSVQNYKSRLKKIELDLNRKEERLRKITENQNTDRTQEIKKLNYEVARLRNLYEYGKDVIINTEKMSLNKNVLRKKYYIVISFYFSNVEGENLVDYEIRDLAFSDLYAKAQSIIRSLSGTGVIGKILNSYEIADLLYNAYNRDESEKYGISKALNAGFDDLYVTAPDLLDKRMKAIEEEINRKALDRAQESVLFAQTEKEKMIAEKEENMEELINEIAKQLIVENSQYMPEDIVENALENVETISQRKRGRPKKNKEVS